MEKQPFIVDCDPGVDDALALLYIQSHPQVSVMGISVVAGNVSAQQCAANTLLVQRWLKQTVPVWLGAKQPLQKPFSRGNVMGESGLGALAVPPLSVNLPNAIEQIKQTLESTPTATTILAIGPLTNLAIVFAERPDLLAKVKRLVILGGSELGIGNMSRVAEFNFFTDPHAAQEVLQLPVEKVLIPLERCYEITIPLEKFTVLKEKSYYQDLQTMLSEYQKLVSADEGYANIVAYDALAAFAALNPQKIKTVPIDAVVETEGQFTEGMLVIEKRPHKVQHQNVQLVTQIDQEAFFTDFFNIIKENTV